MVYTIDIALRMNNKTYGDVLITIIYSTFFFFFFFLFLFC